MPRTVYTKETLRPIPLHSRDLPQGRDKAGRPTDFKVEYIKQARIACEEWGATNEQLSDLFGVEVATLCNWMRQHREFFDAIRDGRDSYDIPRVEKALRERALGYTYEEVSIQDVTIAKYKGKVPKGCEQVTVPAQKITRTTKFALPDPGCIQFYLTNRNKSRWASLQKVESSGELNVRHSGSIDIDKMDRSDLEQLEGIAKKYGGRVIPGTAGKETVGSSKRN